VKSAPKSYPVAPGSVYVWRGYKSAASSYAQFAQFLGSVFVPACVLLQPPVGLRAYLPTMVPQSNSPSPVPDQTALMFWSTPEAHDLAAHAIAVRIYSNLHGDAYDMERSKLQEIPESISTASQTLTPEQPYFLLDQPADWMLGKVYHLVGSRPANVASAEFLSQAWSWASAFHAKPPASVDGALLCCGNDYAVAWVHGPKRAAKLAAALDGLAALTTSVLRVEPVSKPLPAGLWDHWAGLDLTKDGSLNLQFRRPPPARAAPRKPSGK